MWFIYVTISIQSSTNVFDIVYTVLVLRYTITEIPCTRYTAKKFYLTTLKIIIYLADLLVRK